MNVKKAIKRIAALAAGTTMVTATIMGAMAYDLSDYPMPFVEDGVFMGKLVIGQTAQVQDVMGAIDIAASLQAASVKAVGSATTGGSVSVTDGVVIASNSQDMHLGGDITDFNSATYDDDDFPELLATGEMEDDDNTEYEYDQSIVLGSATVEYGQLDAEDYSDEPVFYLDVSGGTTMTFVVEFDDSVDATALTDSQSMDIFGNAYTFDPNHDAGDDLTLYGSDLTVTVAQGEPVTVEVDGEEYTLEVLGGTDAGVVNLRVTGDGTDVVSMSEGENDDIAGLEVFIDDVFVSTIGDESISASIFVGSQSIVIPNEAFAATCTAGSVTEEITVGSDTTSDIFACVQSPTDDDVTDIEAIYFEVDLTGLVNEDIPGGTTEWEYITMGNYFVDPMFGFKLGLDAVAPSLDGRNEVGLVRNDDAYELRFTNNDGDDFAIEVYESTGTVLSVGDDFVTNFTEDDFAEDEFFILNTNPGDDPDDIVSYIFEVRDIDTTEEEVTLKELGSGVTKTYQEGDQIEDTDAYVDLLAAGTFYLVDDAVASNNYTSHDWVIAEGGLNITLGGISAQAADVTFVEDAEDQDDVSTADTLTVTVGVDADDEIDFDTDAAWTTSSYDGITDDDDEYDYGMSEYGTWYMQEVDTPDDELWVYYSEAETDFIAILGGPDSRVLSSSSSSGDSYEIFDMNYGQVAVYDDDAMSMIGDTPLIVVGGPAVNTVAAELLGNPENPAEGFTEGKAKIKFFDSESAILVAGWSGEDTVAASRVLANYKTNNLVGEEVEVIAASMTVNTIA